MKKILIYSTLLFSALLASSCNDWLDVKPEAQVESDDLYKKTKGFEDALIACYVKMKSTDLYGKNMTMTVTEYLAQHWDHTSGNQKDEDALKDFKYHTEYAETSFSTIYGKLYNTIAQANSLLENLVDNGNVIEDTKLRQVIEGEALGIRAFCHTDVLRLFGQLPQNATIQVQLPYAKTVSTDMVGYYSFTEYVNLILEDIAAAQALFKESDPLMTYSYTELDFFNTSDYNYVELENTFMGYRRFRMNYYALEALKARLYLYKGDKEAARTAANNVINAKNEAGNPVVTLSGDNDLKSNYCATPSECLFALNNNDLEEDTKNLFDNMGHFLTPEHYADLFAGQSTDINNRANKIWKTEKTSQGFEFRDFLKYEQPDKNKVSNESMLDLRYQVIPLIRLSEMYLIAMETAASLTEANALYITYMEARNVIATELTQEQLTTEILNEYRREFFGEGQMFYTYKRLGIKKMLWKSDREILEEDYIVPLPSTELGSN